MKTKTLRVGQHVLVGSVYNTFSVPKHLAKIVSVYESHIETRSDPEQGDPDEYKEEEIEGLKIDPEYLLKNGFSQSIINKDRYFLNIEKQSARIVYNISTGSALANGDELAERTGVWHMNDLESLITDAGIDFEFDL